MKRVSLTVLAVAAVLSAGSAFAFGLPKIKTGNSTINNLANKGVETAKNKSLEKIINDKINKQNCTFKDSTTETDTTCDLNKIISDLNNWRSGLEGTLVNNVNVNVEASAPSEAKKASTLASNRASHIREVLYGKMSWWKYSVSSNTSNGNDLKIWVTID